MTAKYNIFFVPPTDDRIKIASLRSKVCKLVHSTQALQYPVHMSLISDGFEVKKYSTFEKELKEFCKNQKAITLKAEKLVRILPDRFWAGIQVIKTGELTQLQTDLQRLRNQYALKKEEHSFHPPHITLAFPAKVDDLKKMKNPVTLIKLDQITIVKKENEEAPYRIYQHLKLGK